MFFLMLMGKKIMMGFQSLENTLLILQKYVMLIEELNNIRLVKNNFILLRMIWILSKSINLQMKGNFKFLNVNVNISTFPLSIKLITHQLAFLHLNISHQ